MKDFDEDALEQEIMNELSGSGDLDINKLVDESLGDDTETAGTRGRAKRSEELPPQRLMCGLPQVSIAPGATEVIPVGIKDWFRPDTLVLATQCFGLLLNDVLVSRVSQNNGRGPAVGAAFARNAVRSYFRGDVANPSVGIDLKLTNPTGAPITLSGAIFGPIAEPGMTEIGNVEIVGGATTQLRADGLQRTWVGITPRTFEPNDSDTVEVKVVHPFRVESFVLAPSAYPLLIEDIKVNRESQNTSTHPVPGEVFAADCIHNYLRGDTAEAANPIEISVRHPVQGNDDSTAPAFTFSGMAVGAIAVKRKEVR